MNGPEHSTSSQTLGRGRKHNPAFGEKFNREREDLVMLTTFPRPYNPDPYGRLPGIASAIRNGRYNLATINVALALNYLLPASVRIRPHGMR